MGVSKFSVEESQYAKELNERYKDLKGRRMDCIFPAFKARFPENLATKKIYILHYRLFREDILIYVCISLLFRVS